ncbi:RCC1 domain containing 1 [Willisornis vidua]|uniref:RCC1 domain containing 1 n=1 Tax=Willisornis vidua TaxID=1566151 RepID=A0ABQ9DDP9_9PASS|nr:RCC1 domain containing 1 [Willisornis vidua]
MAAPARAWLVFGFSLEEAAGEPGPGPAPRRLEAGPEGILRVWPAWSYVVVETEAGDLYVWGWNESGQLALPSKALVEEQTQDDVGTGNAKLMPCQEQSAAKGTTFISIQAFPALLDLPQDLEVSGVSCGSRHTAVVTRKYGQLGHGDSVSSDQARRVEHLVAEGLRAEEVVCGPWTTELLKLAPSTEEWDRNSGVWLLEEGNSWQESATMTNPPQGTPTAAQLPQGRA